MMMMFQQNKYSRNIKTNCELKLVQRDFEPIESIHVASEVWLQFQP